MGTGYLIDTIMELKNFNKYKDACGMIAHVSESKSDISDNVLRQEISQPSNDP